MKDWLLETATVVLIVVAAVFVATPVLILLGRGFLLWVKLFLPAIP